MKKLVLKKQVKPEKKNYRIKYHEELNEEQYEAVMHEYGPALVLAGAGSGKTRTIIYRVARLIEEGTKPEQTLLLSFTRKSANEIKNRAVRLLDGRCEKVFAGTFHSFALSLIKRYFKDLDLPENFSILDSADSLEVMNLVRSRFIENQTSFKKKTRFPNKNFLMKIHSMSINKEEDFEVILENESKFFSKLSKQIKIILDEYVKYKYDNALLDYDDLLIKLNELLKNQSTFKEITSRFKYIMVDEYQDTNRLQHEIVLRLGGVNSNIMVVGDDAQSIYSFRGAEHQNIFFFPDNFQNCKIYKIQQNYRSTQPILDFSNETLKQAHFKYEKELFSDQKEGLKPFLIVAQNERQQSQFLIQQILTYREEQVPLSEIAVLFRSSYHSFDLEIELTNANIPFVKFGGLKLMETAHIKDMISYLRVLHNRKDIIAWSRILNLVDKVGSVTINKILSKISDKTELKSLNTDFLEIANNIDLNSLFKFLAKIESEKDLGTLTEKVSNFYSYFLQKKYDDFEKRQKDLDIFVQISANYKDLDTFLSEMALDPPNASVQDFEASPDDEQLTLTTIHSAKGLEWKYVFLIWTLDGRFPSTFSAKSVDSYEEERRLFYVAVTRAKAALYLSYPINIMDPESGTLLAKPSSFLDGINEEFYDKFELVEEDDEDQ